MVPVRRCCMGSSFFHNVLSSLSSLQSKHGVGVKLRDLVKFMESQYKLSGDVESQIESILKYAKDLHFVTKKNARYSLLSPAAVLHLVPPICLNAEIQRIQDIFDSVNKHNICSSLGSRKGQSKSKSRSRSRTRSSIRNEYRERSRSRSSSLHNQIAQNKSGCKSECNERSRNTNSGKCQDKNRPSTIRTRSQSRNITFQSNPTPISCTSTPKKSSSKEDPGFLSQFWPNALSTKKKRNNFTSLPCPCSLTNLNKSGSSKKSNKCKKKSLSRSLFSRKSLEHLKNKILRNGDKPCDSHSSDSSSS